MDEVATDDNSFTQIEDSDDDIEQVNSLEKAATLNRKFLESDQGVHGAHRQDDLRLRPATTQLAPANSSVVDTSYSHDIYGTVD